MRTILLLTTSVLASCAGFPKQQAPVTRQRPTLSVDTDTTAVGTIEVESGVDIDPSDFWRLPTTIKYGASENTELFIADSLWTHIDDTDGDGPEDLRIGVRHRLLEETGSRPSVGVMVQNQLPTGNRADGLGSGGTQFFVAAMASKSFDQNRLTAFYQFGLLDDPNGGGPDVEHDLAVAGAHRFDEQWSAFAELAGILVDDRDYEAAFTTLGAAYAVSQYLVLDAGVVIGLSHDAPDFQLVFGGTFNLGRLFAGTAAPGPRP